MSPPTPDRSHPAGRQEPSSLAPGGQSLPPPVPGGEAVGPPPPATPEELRHLIEVRKAAHPHLADHFDRQFLIELHNQGIVSIDRIHDEAREAAGRAPRPLGTDPNQPEGSKLDALERHTLSEKTCEYVCRHLSADEINRIFDLTIKRDVVRELDDYAKLPAVPTRLLREKVARFTDVAASEHRLPQAEVMGTRVALIRNFISDHLEFIGIAKNYLAITDINRVASRIIDMERGQGRIGGKAGGMVLAERILASFDDLHAEWPVHTPESWFLRSDILGVFLELNRLNEFQSQKYKSIDEIRHEYPLVRGVFRNSDFPVEVVQQLRAILKETGTHPMIVRSSSLLEDRIGSAFSGKYASVFVANQGDLETRLQALLVAISEVFASTLGPDPIAYRREHNLLDYHEDMGVLIQKVVGTQVGKYFLPAFAGVAFSRNEYRWSPRIKREDGMMRLVMGLGTRAVDRVGNDYPRMVALGCPTLRPETTGREIMRYSQRTIDVINLETNRLEPIELPELLAAGPVPMLDKIVSESRDDGLYPPMGTVIRTDPQNLCITFDKLLGQTAFAEAMRRMLTRLEEAYGAPVDVEFACDGNAFHLLQCRALAARDVSARVTVPANVTPEHVAFSAHRYVSTGRIKDIEYVVYVNSHVYDAVETREQRVEIGRVVGRVNRALARRRFILVGPGRWGSSDIRLGIPVGYADISATRLLIEVARDKAGYIPEVSFGTHFFQDLVEAGIHYLPLYPDDAGSAFNDAFFLETPNALAEVCPADAGYASFVRVIHVPTFANGRLLHVAMDGEKDEALAYFK